MVRAADGGVAFSVTATVNDRAGSLGQASGHRAGERPRLFAHWRAGAVPCGAHLPERLDGEEFTDHDQEVILALASAAGVAIENAMPYAETRLRQVGQTASTRLVVHDVRADPGLTSLATRCLDHDLTRRAPRPGRSTHRVAPHRMPRLRRPR